MYHYVRDDASVPARTTAELEAQLDYVARTYEPIGLGELRGASGDACLLTFDDGLREHFETVAPVLERRGLWGVFCVPAQPVLERTVLDVQKTQLLLAAVRDHAALGRRVLELAEVGELPAQPPHRFDPPETVLVKRALQDGLPEERRRLVLDRLFSEHVTANERVLADELYVTADECRELVRRGHAVIGHGYEHRRLGLLAESEQRDELVRTRAFLDEVGGTWALCYPYGSRDETTLRLMRETECRVGLTTDLGRATAGSDRLQLPRIDTNDLQREVIEGIRVDRPVAEGP